MGLLQALSLPPPKNSAVLAGSDDEPPSTQREAVKPPAAAHAAAAQHGAKSGAKSGGKHAPPPKAGKLTQNNYGAFIVAFVTEIDNWQQPLASIDTGNFPAAQLVPAHRQLVLGLHTAIVLSKTDPANALVLWEKVQPQLRAESRKAATAGVPKDGITLAIDGLAEIDKKLFVPAAYYQAQRDAEANSTLVAPDLQQFAGKIQAASKELMSAKELYETSVAVAGHIGGLGNFPSVSKVKDIIELVGTPGSIEEKLAEARKRGIATTAAELMSKTMSATGFIVETSYEVGKKVIDAQKALLLKKAVSASSKKALADLAKLGERCEKGIALGKAIAKGAAVAAAIADGIRLFSAIREGDWEAAVGAGADLLVDIAPLVVVEGGGTLLTGIVTIVKAEIAAIHMAAEFIRWCKDETVRQAALSFIVDCNKCVPAAKQLVAALDVLLAATNPGVQEMAERKANQMAAITYKNLRALGSHVGATTKDAIGGHAAVVASLGSAARLAFTVTFDEKDGAMLVAQQMADVFGGANQMAKFVRDHYKN